MDFEELSDERSSQGGLVIALVGLALEARIAARSNVFVVCHEKKLGCVDSLESAFKAGCRNIISFGLAGGLAPELRPGDVIIASTIIDGEVIRPTSAAWSSRLCRSLSASNFVPLIGIDVPIPGVAARRELHTMLGAAAVDNESHIMSRFACENAMTFAALRVIVDPAHRFLPDAALLATRSNGTIDVAAVLRKIRSRPLQALSLLRLAMDLMLARSQLIRIHHLLGDKHTDAISRPQLPRPAGDRAHACYRAQTADRN